MDLQHIRYFLELAKELHFWNTSEKIFITQSALSRHIKALEEELGFRLFDRDKRNVKLTAAGVVMQREWEKILLQIDNIHHHAKQVYEGEMGSIRIGHPGSMTHSALPELALTLNKMYPKIKIEFIEMMTVDLEKALLGFQVDIGFRRDTSLSNSLETKSLFSENFALLLPNTYKIKAKKLDNIRNFKDENFILPNLEVASNYNKILKKIFEDADFIPKTQLASEFGSTIISLIGQGLGISVMPISYLKSAPSNVQFIELPMYNSALFAQWRKNDDNPVLLNFKKFGK
jgi:DNA-binding transcriptional LysR family regulator